MESDEMNAIVVKLRHLQEDYNHSKQQADPALFYDFYVNPTIHPRLILGPIEATDGISRALAEKIAEKNGVCFNTYNFASGKWSEAADYRAVFYVELSNDENTYKSDKEKLVKAAKEFKEKSARIVESVM